MFRSVTPFPTIAVCISAFLALCGFWLILKRSRRHLGTEPRCHHCDYILIGITSERCPECGTIIDPDQAARGCRRSRTIRVVVGLVLLVISLAISCNPVMGWVQSVYWYQFRPTYLVMRDLKCGSGKVPPKNNPLQQGLIFGHGFLSERVDLARVALDELLRRDKLGKLSPEYRHEIDEMALANLGVPITTPVQYYLNAELGDRLIAGKLTADEQATIYRRAATVSVSAQPIVMQWDPTPLRFRFRTCLPSSSNGTALIIDAIYKSVRVDGKEVQWWRCPQWGQSADTTLYTGADISFDRWIPYSALGQHSIDLDIQIDIHYDRSAYPERGPIIHSELRTFSARFVETRPTMAAKMVRFLEDPEHESGHYLSARWLKFEIAFGPAILRDLGIIEMIHRDELGELTTGEEDYLVDQILAIQKDRAQPWNGAYGDYLESQRAENKLPDAKWREYGNHQLGFYVRTRPEIRQGDCLPFDLLTLARRGNAQVERFSGSQWNIECTFSPDIPRPWELAFWNGSNIICVTQDEANFATRYVVTFPPAPMGPHAMWAKLKYNPAWTERPLNMKIPTEYNLGKVDFAIVPRSTETLTSQNDAKIRKQVQQCITISNILRWRDGSLTFSIDAHHPPVDLAFHVSLQADNHEWKVGDIFSEKDSESNPVYDGFRIEDAKTMPTKGLIFKFKADPDIARRSVGFKEYCNGDITIGDVVIGDDEYQKAQQ